MSGMWSILGHLEDDDPDVTSAASCAAPRGCDLVWVSGELAQSAPAPLGSSQHAIRHRERERERAAASNTT